MSRHSRGPVGLDEGCDQRFSNSASGVQDFHLRLARGLGFGKENVRPGVGLNWRQASRPCESGRAADVYEGPDPVMFVRGDVAVSICRTEHWVRK